MNRLDSLQAVRGAASLLVLGSHLGDWECQRGTGYAWLAAARPGYAGVDLFFALSGFVLAWGQLDRPAGLLAAGRFLAHRFWRVLPVYWVMMAVAAVAYHLALGVTLLAPAGEFGWPYWLTLSPAGPENVYIAPAWSLTFELTFYLMLAAGLAAGRWWVVLAGWAAVMAAAMLAGWQPADPYLRTLLSPYGLEFQAGCVAAVMARWRPSRRGVWWAFAGGAAGALVAAGKSDLYPDAASRMVLFGPAAGVCLYGLVSAERAGHLAASRWLVAAGGMSYSLYLVHWPVGRVLFHFTGGFGTGPLAHAAWLAVVGGGCLVAGFVTYRLVERPLLRLARVTAPAQPAARPGHTARPPASSPPGLPPAAGPCAA